MNTTIIISSASAVDTVESRAADALIGPAARVAPARCADGHGTLTPLFFSDDVVDIARAKAICAKCKRASTCLDEALDRAEPWGVWGGQLIENGRIVAVKRPRGRPPKHPRPVLVVDEVLLPPRRTTHMVA